MLSYVPCNINIFIVESMSLIIIFRYCKLLYIYVFSEGEAGRVPGGSAEVRGGTGRPRGAMGGPGKVRRGPGGGPGVSQRSPRCSLGGPRAFPEGLGGSSGGPTSPGDLFSAMGLCFVGPLGSRHRIPGRSPGDFRRTLGGNEALAIASA